MESRRVVCFFFFRWLKCQTLHSGAIKVNNSSLYLGPTSGREHLGGRQALVTGGGEAEAGEVGKSDTSQTSSTSSKTYMELGT